MVLSEFGYQSPMIPVMDFGANEICHSECQNSTDGVDPKVIACDDDAECRDNWIEQKCETHPQFSCYRPQPECAPSCPADVQRRHRGILIGYFAASTAIKRPWPAIFSNRVDESEIFSVVEISLFTFDACRTITFFGAWCVEQSWWHQRKK